MWGICVRVCVCMYVWREEWRNANYISAICVSEEVDWVISNQSIRIRSCPCCLCPLSSGRVYMGERVCVKWGGRLMDGARALVYFQCKQIQLQYLHKLFLVVMWTYNELYIQEHYPTHFHTHAYVYKIMLCSCNSPYFSLSFSTTITIMYHYISLVLCNAALLVIALAKECAIHVQISP